MNVAQAMRDTCADSRCQKPLLHISFSFDRMDGDGREMVEGFVDHFLNHERIGLREHQVFMVAHGDTEHAHVHLQINRVHPVTGKAWSDWQDYRRTERVCREFERDRALTEAPEPHAVQAHRAAVRRGDQALAARLKLDTLIGWGGEARAQLRDQCSNLFDRARSWDQLDDMLGQAGLVLVRKGQGLIASDGKHYAKLSDLTRKADRLAKLEQRYGQAFDEFASVRAAGSERPRRRLGEKRPNDLVAPFLRPPDRTQNQRHVEPERDEERVVLRPVFRLR